MNVLVLGGTRFFGKVLVEQLINKGYKVTIATRGISEDSYGEKVNRIILDREDRESIKKALKDEKFEVVYDNLCYSSNSADILCDIIKDKTKKYIVVSSSAVYDFSKNIKEEAFNPFNYKLKYGERNDFSYSEGKRVSEALIFQKYNIPTKAVRFPVVLGKDDYTQRLYSYVESIIKGDPINIDNLYSELSFISNKEAGEFLAFLSESDYNGQINAASEGFINIKDIINYIENKTNKKAIINNEGKNAAYNGMLDCSLNIDKAKKIGFKFNNLNEYIYEIIDFYIKNINDEK